MSTGSSFLRSSLLKSHEVQVKGQELRSEEIEATCIARLSFANGQDIARGNAEGEVIGFGGRPWWRIGRLGLYLW